MLDFICANPYRLLGAIIVCCIILAGFALTLMHLGQKREQVKNLKEANKASEKVKQNAEKIINNNSNPFDTAAKLREKNKRK